MEWQQLSGPVSLGRVLNQFADLDSARAGHKPTVKHSDTPAACSGHVQRSHVPVRALRPPLALARPVRSQLECAHSACCALRHEFALGPLYTGTQPALQNIQSAPASRRVAGSWHRTLRQVHLRSAVRLTAHTCS